MLVACFVCPSFSVATRQCMKSLFLCCAAALFHTICMDNVVAALPVSFSLLSWLQKRLSPNRMHTKPSYSRLWHYPPSRSGFCRSPAWKLVLELTRTRMRRQVRVAKLQGDAQVIYPLQCLYRESGESQQSILSELTPPPQPSCFT